MLWVYAIVTTVGFVTIVPIMAQTLDVGATSQRVESVGADTLPPGSNGSGVSLTAFAGFALCGAGLCGLIALSFGTPAGITAVAALCLGAATGAVHPEILTWLRGRGKATAVSAEQD